MITNLGHALTILARHEASQIDTHEELRAFHAPSECYDLVAARDVESRREARRHACAVARRPYRVLRREAARRGLPIGSPRWQEFVSRLCYSN